MKTKLFLAIAGLLLGASTVKATDICVNENGNGGCYSTISAAISAAANGDRILISPKAGNAPYVENLSVNKSLQFLCASDTLKYFLQGAITITPAAGRSITFIGMKQVGNMAPTTASPAGLRCNVSVFASDITGDLNFDYDNFNFTMSSTILNGNVAFKFGKIIGNYISTVNGYYTSGWRSDIYIGTDATSTNDTILIVGNKIQNNAPGQYTYGITANSTSQFVHIYNNLITVAASTVGYGGGIYFYQYKNSAISRNLVVNNTVSSTIGISMGIYFGGAPVNAYTDVINNLVLAPSVAYGSIYGAYGTIGISYNYSNVAFYSNTLDLCACNNQASNTTLDLSGRPNVGTDAINGGSPDFSYYDLNLTINDAGAYGGSFSLDNFFPITGSTRVFMVNAPRRVNVSGTINIKADAIDR